MIRHRGLGMCGRSGCGIEEFGLFVHVIPMEMVNLTSKSEAAAGVSIGPNAARGRARRAAAALAALRCCGTRGIAQSSAFPSDRSCFAVVTERSSHD